MKLAVIQMVLGLAIAVTCFVAQNQRVQTEFTFPQPDGHTLTINIYPSREMLRPQHLARAASVLGLVVFGSGVAQFRKAIKGYSEPNYRKTNDLGEAQ